jgi:hypothetical protein
MPRYPAYSVALAGFVELREESQKTDRFVLRVARIEGNRIVGQPERVRLSVRRGMAPPAGAFIETKAQLNPPLQPLRPGSYDFARDLYLQRIGASGFVHGAIKVVTPPEAASLRMRANAFIQGLRDGIDQRASARCCRATSAPSPRRSSPASENAVTKSAANAAHFLTCRRSAKPGISASSARRMKNTMPATTAM